MNFVCLVFELGDKTLALSPMENLMVKCNLLKCWEKMYFVSEILYMIMIIPNRCGKKERGGAK